MDEIMNTTPAVPAIYGAILGAMKDIGAISKDSKNAQQGFMYRGIDAVMNALQPALVQHGIFVVPEMLEQKREERVTGKGGNLIYSVIKMKYTFIAADGSRVCATVIGEGMDSGDKASNKAMSVAFKYACFQVFCIPTEEMKDPDADAPEPSVKKEEKDPDADTHEPSVKKEEKHEFIALLDAEKEAEELGMDLDKVAAAYGVERKNLTSAILANAIARKRAQIAAREAKSEATV